MKVLVVVDYQNDFVDGALGFEGANLLEKPISAAVEKTLANGGYVVFTKDTHGDDYLQTREGRFLPIAHCVKGTQGHNLYGALAQYENSTDPKVHIVEKAVFGSVDLAGEILELCGEVPEAVELCGLVTDICVVANAIVLHAAFEDTDVSVVQKLCGSGNKENAAAAEAVLAGLGILR